MENAKHQASRFQVFAVVTFYMIAALVMVLANKWVLNSSSLPLTFLFVQLIIAVILIQTCVLFGWLKLPQTDMKLLKAIIAIVIVNIAGLIFNTLCLKLVDASYFQIARGMVLPLTIALSSALLKQRPPHTTTLCCLLVTMGFFYGISPDAASPTNESKNTHLGIIYGFISALMIACHAILVKWSMRHVDVKDMDAGFVTNLAYLTNLLSAAFLFPILILNGEIWHWKGLFFHEDGDLGTFLIGSAITGVFGFFICMAGLLSITVTSPVTHMFSSAVRSVLQAILGIALFGDILTVPRAVSLTFIISGSALYAYFKAIKPSHPPSGAHKALDEDDPKYTEEGRSSRVVRGEESVPMLEKRTEEEEDDDEELERELEAHHLLEMERRKKEEEEKALPNGSSKGKAVAEEGDGAEEEEELDLDELEREIMGSVEPSGSHKKMSKAGKARSD